MPQGNARAKVACRLCHRRRVKCDRSDGFPCSNCQIAQSACEPIISRRGRTRKLPIRPLAAGQNGGFSPTPQGISDESGIASSLSVDNNNPQSGHNAYTKGSCFPAIDSNGKTPYIGDASNLNYLIEQFGDPFRCTPDARPLEEHLQGVMVSRLGRPTTQHMERLHTSTVERLISEGAFDLPSKEISDALVDIYFCYSSPSMPVLDKSGFLSALRRGTVSLLLLNAVYLVATVYCSDTVINASGFVSRYVANLTFYRRSKSLYDAGYEADTIAIVQATLLMGHWWSGLLEPKDPWYWLGISAGMAQALGMHQAKSYVRLKQEDRKLWRRLWWMVYAMDINLSMLLDRPPRVQGRLCDVPPLSEADFDQASGSEKDIFGGTYSEQILFAVYTVQLARIVDRCYTIKFADDNSQSQDFCLDQILLWSSSLPPELQLSSAHSSAWASLIQILHQQYRLLLHRSNPRFSQNTGPGTPTFKICTEISRMLEFLVTNDLVYAAAATILPSALSTLSIHIFNIQKGDRGARLISEHRARFCMLILDKLQDRWPIIASFYPFFETLLTRLSADVPTQHDTTGPERSETASSTDDMTSPLCNRDDISGLEPARGSFDQILQDSMNTTSVSSFPFSSLIEDIFLASPPPRPVSHREGDSPL